MTAPEKLTIVSCDTHISPLRADLAAYCPERYREAFADDTALDADQRDAQARALYEQTCRTNRVDDGGAAAARAYAAITAPGAHDMHARLRDFDRDGVAAAVVFHGAQTPERIPFTPTTGGPPRPFPFNLQADQSATFDAELVAVGIHMYNQWLADACTIEPERQIGLAQLPFWDPELATAEAEWAGRAGLRGVNLPSPRPGVAGYDDPVWDGFFGACAANDLVLVNHSAAGGAGFFEVTNPALRSSLIVLEAHPVARRIIGRLILGGVFDRHPTLRLALTEQPGEWYPELMRSMDQTFELFGHMLEPALRRRPSEYFPDHVFVGASFLAPYERRRYESEGLADNVMWGSDYPHIEGTWRPAEEPDEVPLTQLSLRHSFAGCTPDVVRKMVGQNAIRVFGLDADALARVASRINAPTAAQLAEPLESRPAAGSRLAFRA